MTQEVPQYVSISGLRAGTDNKDVEMIGRGLPGVLRSEPPLDRSPGAIKRSAPPRAMPPARSTANPTLYSNVGDKRAGALQPQSGRSLAMQQVGGDGRNGTGKPAEENLWKPKREADGLSAEPGPGKPLGADGLSAEPGRSPSRGRADTATADEQGREEAPPSLQGSHGSLGHVPARHQRLSCLSTASSSTPLTSSTSDRGAAETIGAAPRETEMQ